MASCLNNDPSGIYRFTNTINGKMYIGMSNHINYRRKQHLRDLRRNDHVNRHFQAAFNKYGEDAFRWDILEYCAVEVLEERERYWIAFYDSFAHGYNATAGGDGSNGKVWTEEMYEKMSIPVVCLNTMCRYSSVKEAASAMHTFDSSIIRVCTGRARYAGTNNGDKLVWRYASDLDGLTQQQIDEMVNDVRMSSKRKKASAVVCLSDRRQFSSQRDAAKYYGVSRQRLNSCVKGRDPYILSQDGSVLVFCTLDSYRNMDEDTIEHVLSEAKRDRERRRVHAGETRKRKVVAFPGECVFNSVGEAADALRVLGTSVSTSCSTKVGRKPRVHSDDGSEYIFAYFDDYRTMDEAELEQLRLQGAVAPQRRPSRHRAVRLLNTGEVFETIKDAAEMYGIAPSSVRAACSKKSTFGGKTSSGEKLRWEYVA